MKINIPCSKCNIEKTFTVEEARNFNKENRHVCENCAESKSGRISAITDFRFNPNLAYTIEDRSALPKTGTHILEETNNETQQILTNQPRIPNNQESLDSRQGFVLITCFVVLIVGFSFLMGPEISHNDPDINNHLNNYTHDQLRDLSIRACNQGQSPDPNSDDYSYTLQLELKQLGETECP